VKDSDGCKMDEGRDYCCNYLFDFIYGAEERGVGAFDEIAHDDTTYENGEEAVGGKGVNDVVGNERLEHIDDDVVDGYCLTILYGILVVFGDEKRFASDGNHELRPYETHKDAAMEDGNESCDHIVADCPACKDGTAFAHVTEALYGEDHGCDNHG